ncbi:hypothetical protein DH2020_039910 [Rehmannia glutinosa]|uniref:Uncharacterized protein n=1 Tax=Rehmannia glutinosa TaxID=99300 RepID=A0ABR0UUG0_REHGL
MASMGQNQYSDDLVTLICSELSGSDPDENPDDVDEIQLSTAEIGSWDLPLVEESSYFRGLLSGSFSESRLGSISIHWNMESFVSVLMVIFGCQLEISPDNFIPLNEAALFFGVDVLLLKCRVWLDELTSFRELGQQPQLSLGSLIQIWKYGMEHGKMWALTFNSYTDVPDKLLWSCIQHPDLTVDSEKHLCDAILVWLAAKTAKSEGWCSNDLCDKEKRRCRFFSKFADEATRAILSLARHPRTTLTDIFREGNSSHLRIRLTKYTQKVDVSGCPQLTTGLFLLSMLPSCGTDLILRKIIKKSSINHANSVGDGLHISQALGQMLTFEAVQELDISNCPSLSLESAIEYINPVIPAQVSITASSSVLTPQRSTESFDIYNCHSASSLSYTSRPLLSNIMKLTLEGRTDISGQWNNGNILSELTSGADHLRSLCLREIQLVDDALYRFSGASLEMLDVSDTKVSSATLSHVIHTNPGLKSLKARGCRHLLVQESAHTPEELYSVLGNLCKLEEIELGWGFSFFSLGDLKPAIRTLRTLVVGLGGSLGPDGLKLLPTICPILETLILYFQVISDSVITDIIKTLPYLQSLALCYCYGDISSLSFKYGMPNLRKLKLERVTPWMTNDDLATLVENCVNLVKLSLIGCTLLDSGAQVIISSGWPGLTSLHLEECGEITAGGVRSLLDCHALEDLIIRHNGRGIPRNFIIYAASKLPMLQKISLDICDSREGDFDIPSIYFLSIVKIARCKLRKSTLDLHNLEARRNPVHKETLVLVWNSEKLVRTVEIMPKVKTNRVKYPEGWELIEPTLRELQAKMREAENDPHDGKRKCEGLWPIFKIAHQKSRYVFDLYHRRKEISKELYEFCLDQGYADRNLIAKWKKPGYERLCCLRCMQPRDHNFQTTCVCRVPKHLREEKVIECVHCGCGGCASGD